MPSERVVSVTPDPARPATFDVVVCGARSESRHRVTVPVADVARWAKLGVDPAAGVAAAMRFLLDREPKESILAAFDIDVIRRYFPEFDEALPVYLSLLSGEAGDRA
jgi:hypothetical protein